LSDEAYDFHWLAAVRANEGRDLKDASHQKCPHYRGFTVRFATIRFTIRPAILVLVLFEVEWGVGACCDASCGGVDFAAVVSILVSILPQLVVADWADWSDLSADW
jgi:hypothetical protein